eukprot:gene12527-44629_t
MLDAAPGATVAPLEKAAAREMFPNDAPAAKEAGALFVEIVRGHVDVERDGDLLSMSLKEGGFRTEGTA